MIIFGDKKKVNKFVERMMIMMIVIMIIMKIKPGKCDLNGALLAKEKLSFAAVQQKCQC